METNIDRIKRDLENLAKFTAEGEGITRFSYSEHDRLARNYLLDEITRLGLHVTIDGVGNIRARLDGSDSDAPAVMAGSHIDSVLHGGKYDGALGTVAALEAIRVMSEQKFDNTHPVDLVIFSEEEGSNFGSTLAGSKAMVGKYTVEDLKTLKNPEGRSMYDMAKDAGFDPDAMPQYVLKPGELKAMLELHVEQSVVLENEKASIGVVEAIAGMKTLKLTFGGVANHAGATPMTLRQDPMVGAATVIVEIEKLVKNTALSTTVGTVGRIYCRPNVPNIIPGEVVFTLDVRDVNTKGIEIVVSETEKMAAKLAKERGLEHQVELIGESPVVVLDEKVADVVENAARKKGYEYRRMNSGAVHDCAMLAGLTSVGLIFVPSIQGRSHVPEENTHEEDIRKGCDVMLETVATLAK